MFGRPVDEDAAPLEVELFHVVRSHDACLVCTVHVATARRFTL